MLYLSFRSTDKKGKTFLFIVLPLIDISNFCDTEIVDILPGTVDSKLVVNSKPPDRSGVKCSNNNNTNITETPSFNKFKTDIKITKSM